MSTRTTAGTRTYGWTPRGAAGARSAGRPRSLSPPAEAVGLRADVGRAGLAPRGTSRASPSRRRRRILVDRGHGQGRSRRQWHDEAVSASGGGRVPRRGRRARTAARTFYQPSTRLTEPEPPEPIKRRV